jgi:hypothetical protein
LPLNAEVAEENGEDAEEKRDTAMLVVTNFFSSSSSFVLRVLRVESVRLIQRL